MNTNYYNHRSLFIPKIHQLKWCKAVISIKRGSTRCFEESEQYRITLRTLIHDFFVVIVLIILSLGVSQKPLHSLIKETFGDVKQLMNLFLEKSRL